MGELHGGVMVVVVVLVARMTCRRAGKEIAQGNGLNGGRCSAIAAVRSQGCPGLRAGRGGSLGTAVGDNASPIRAQSRRVGCVVEAQLVRAGGCPERDEGLVRGNERAGCKRWKSFRCVCD
jgi:hypothetical protein